MTRRHTTAIGAFILFTLHIFFVTTPVLMAGGNGEGQAFLLMFADFPLVMMLLPIGALNNKTGYYILACLLGPLMYASIGALAGYGLGRLFLGRKPPAANDISGA